MVVAVIGVVIDVQVGVRALVLMNGLIARGCGHGRWMNWWVDWSSVDDSGIGRSWLTDKGVVRNKADMGAVLLGTGV